jgi:hypothetical protein
VYQGELEDAQEPYMQTLEKKADMDKAKKKITDAVPAFCGRWGNYRQAFAWAVIPLFKKDGTLEIKQDVTIDTLYQQTAKTLSDSDLIDFIHEMTVSYMHNYFL